MFRVVAASRAKRPDDGQSRVIGSNLADAEGNGRSIGPGEAINAGPPSTPRPAASMVLVRSAAGVEGIEVLMAQRTEKAAFMPGAWVFPGGALDECDGAPDEHGLAHRECAQRELQEEVGVRLAPSSEIVPFSRWITPEQVTVRFDAWFFIAAVQEPVVPVPDGIEAVDAGWFRPETALERHLDGEMSLAFPTVHQLRELRGFRDPGALIAEYRDRMPEIMLPKPIEAEDGIRLTLPGDPDYPAG